MEQLRHSAPIISLQWSAGDLLSGAHHICAAVVGLSNLVSEVFASHPLVLHTLLPLQLTPQNHALNAFCSSAGSDEADGYSGTLLRPAQPALLTMTNDGVMRIWVEVTMAPPQRAANGAAPNQAAPGLGASQTNQASWRAFSLGAGLHRILFLLAFFLD